MLTRIEIDGFKSYVDFHMDLGTLAVVLGANGVGKSNLFDALYFLTRLAQAPLVDAVRDLRGRPHELFAFDSEGRPGSTMRLAVELLVPTELQDDFGRTFDLKDTRLRYEVVLVRGAGQHGLEALHVQAETMTRITAAHDAWRPNRVSPSTDFKRDFYRTSQRRSPFLSTTDGEFSIHQDGVAGRVRKLSATTASATVLSTVTSAEEFPHLYAVRKELMSWLFLHLEPSAIRDRTVASWRDQLESDGRNLGRVLDRIRRETATEMEPAGALTDIAADLRDIVDGVTGLAVEPDASSREFRIVIEMGQQHIPFSSHLVSDGTLRALAVCTVLNDPSFSGVLFMEEPEDGMHPARLVQLIQRIREHVSDAHARRSQLDQPLQQVITNSHSPVVLAAVRDTPAEAWFADTIEAHTEGSAPRRRTRIRPVDPTEQGELLQSDRVPRFEVERYLKTVHGGS